MAGATAIKKGPNHSVRPFAVKKILLSIKKEGTPAPAKNYLQPTTTTNGVNTSRAGYAMS